MTLSSPHTDDIRKLEAELIAHEQLSVNSVYGRFQIFMEQWKQKILLNVLVVPMSVEAILARERLLGVAEAIEQNFLPWAANDKADLEDMIKQLKLGQDEEELEKPHKHED